MLSTGGHAGGLALEAPITVLCVGCRNSLPAALSSHGLVIVFVALYGVGVGAGGRRRGASCGPRCPLALAAPGPSRDSGMDPGACSGFGGVIGVWGVQPAGSRER